MFRLETVLKKYIAGKQKIRTLNSKVKGNHGTEGTHEVVTSCFLYMALHDCASVKWKTSSGYDNIEPKNNADNFMFWTKEFLL